MAKLIKCCDCSSEFASLSQLEGHLSLSHLAWPRYKCAHCEGNFYAESEENIIDHIRSSHPEMIIDSEFNVIHRRNAEMRLNLNKLIIRSIKETGMNKAKKSVSSRKKFPMTNKDPKQRSMEDFISGVKRKIDNEINSEKAKFRHSPILTKFTPDSPPIESDKHELGIVNSEPENADIDEEDGGAAPRTLSIFYQEGEQIPIVAPKKIEEKVTCRYKDCKMLVRVSSHFRGKHVIENHLKRKYLICKLCPDYKINRMAYMNKHINEKHPESTKKPAKQKYENTRKTIESSKEYIDMFYECFPSDPTSPESSQHELPCSSNANNEVTSPGTPECITLDERDDSKE